MKEYRVGRQVLTFFDSHGGEHVPRLPTRSPRHNTCEAVTVCRLPLSTTHGHTFARIVVVAGVATFAVRSPDHAFSNSADDACMPSLAANINRPTHPLTAK